VFSVMVQHLQYLYQWNIFSHSQNQINCLIAMQVVRGLFQRGSHQNGMGVPHR
jgi:hypothetical protein